MAETVVNSLSGLQKAMEKETREAVQYAAEKLTTVLIFKIDTLWYDRSGYGQYHDKTPSYERTFQLQDAVTAKKSDKVLGSYIFIDPDKITPEKNPNAKYNSYMSLDGKTEQYRGRRLTEMVPIWIETGNA